MTNDYLALKFAHILIAVMALGTGASVGILLSFFANDSTHGEFVQRLARKLLTFVVIPGYVLMLVSGMWMGHSANLLDAHWTEAAMNLWGIGGVLFALLLWSLRKQSKRALLMSRVFGAGVGVVIA